MYEQLKQIGSLKRKMHGLSSRDFIHHLVADRTLAESHDHILLYARQKLVWRPNRLPRNEEMDRRYRNPDSHPKGVWKATPLYLSLIHIRCV